MPSNTGQKGVDVRQTGNQLVFRALLQNSSGALVTSGTTSLYLYELQSDGSLKSYDWSSNTFKTTALTTETASMTHQTGNNGGTNTGVWTYALSTLTGFTVGAIYLARVSNSSASPADQYREFQYGGDQGDLLVTAGSTGQAYLQTDAQKLAGQTAQLDGNNLLKVDVEDIRGTVSTGAAGYVGLDWGHINAPTTVVALSGTTVGTVTAVTGGATLANQTTIINAVNGLTTNTARSAPRVPGFLARPAAGSTVYVADLYLYNLQGQLEDADASTVTVHARNAAGVSLDGGLSSTTMTRLSTGKYRLTYTVQSTDVAQAVYFDFTWAVGAISMADGAATEVQDAENYAYLSAIKTQTDRLTFTGAGNLQADVQTIRTQTVTCAAPVTVLASVGTATTSVAQSGDNFARLGAPTGASIAADLAAVKSDTGTVLARVTGAVALAGTAPTWWVAPDTGATIAGDILNATASSYNTAGSIGNKINTASSAADPLNNLVPGSYASGTAGNVLGNIVNGQVRTSSPVHVNGRIEIVIGDDYYAADGLALLWNNPNGNWPNLTGAAIMLDVNAGMIQAAGSVNVPTGTGQQVQVQLSRAQTTANAVVPGTYPYQVKATLGDGHVCTIATGRCTVYANQA